MRRRACLIGGLAILALVWLGPLPVWAGPSFSAHMLMHLGVLAVAAPLLALGLADRLGTTRMPPAVPLLASALELVIVSLWHVPVAHELARSNGWILAIEQASFLACGLFLWSSALRDPATLASRNTAAAGVMALLLTSMHMTLLGALIALSPRELYRCAPLLADWAPIVDQQLGGALMLIATSAIYLFAGLFQLQRVLSQSIKPPPPPAASLMVRD